MSVSNRLTHLKPRENNLKKAVQIMGVQIQIDKK